MTDDTSQLASFACALADAARAETLSRWNQAGTARNKALDGSFDPVTEADITAEKAIRALIEAHYPEHGIIGEECADRDAQGRFSWVIDPIDGTRSFVCGLPSWGTLIALLADGAPLVGVIDIPRLDERYVGFGSHAALREPTGERALRTSGCTRLSEARFSSTDPYLFGPDETGAFERIRSAVRTTRYGLDCYGYARIAAGSIDLVIESGLKIYDYSALVPVIAAAGGSIANWGGGSDLSAGRIIAAATPALLEEAVKRLADA